MADVRYDESSILVLEGLEPVRLRPSMYVGALEAPDLPVHLLLESLCHAADAAMEGACTSVAITTDGLEAEVAYDAGLPLDVPSGRERPAAYLFFTILAACMHLKKHVEVGDALCKLGLAVLNALCASMAVTTCWRGKTATYRFERGRDVGSRDVLPTDEPDRTVIRFRLDPEILGSNVRFDRAALAREVDRVRTLLPALRIDVIWR